MDILDAIKKGKQFRTKSGLRATFIAFLPDNIPARLLMEIFYPHPDFGMNEFEFDDDDEFEDYLPSLENYYLNGKYIWPHQSQMDLVVDKL